MSALLRVPSCVMAELSSSWTPIVQSTPYFPAHRKAARVQLAYSCRKCDLWEVTGHGTSTAPLTHGSPPPSPMSRPSHRLCLEQGLCWHLLRQVKTQSRWDVGNLPRRPPFSSLPASAWSLWRKAQGTNEAVSTVVLLVCDTHNTLVGQILSLVNTYGHVQAICYSTVTIPWHRRLGE